jgi:hypothetical protein
MIHNLSSISKKSFWIYHNKNFIQILYDKINFEIHEQSE